jgi:hypothetical protein
MLTRPITIKPALWKRQWDRCWLCNRRGGALGRRLDRHEIRGGPCKARADKAPASWVILCDGCHRDMQSQPRHYALMLALKRENDPETYDRAAVNSLISPTYRDGFERGPISEADVDAAEMNLSARKERNDHHAPR